MPNMSIQQLYCISFPQRSHMCHIDEIANLVHSFDIFHWDTCCLCQCIPTISFFSLSDSCDVFDVFAFEVHSMYNKIKLSLWPCYQAKIFLLYCLTLFWISCSFFSIYLVCTYFCEDKYLRDVVHLETYTHER